MSLEARVCITMGINIGSHVIFWENALFDLGIQMSKSLHNVLTEKDKN